MDINHFISLTIELTIGFIALLIITKVLGKTQISQITPFDFISALVLGEMVGNAIYDKEINIYYIIYSLSIWSLLMFIIEKITQKLKGTRSIFEGKPAILIRHGKIDYELLKKEKIDINELLTLLRQKEAFSIREIEYAILEPSGAMSVLKKSKYSMPTMEDMNLPYKPVYLPITFIMDGEIIWDNIEEMGFDKQWLEKEIKALGINKIEDVLYAEWKEDEGLYVVKY